MLLSSDVSRSTERRRGDEPGAAGAPEPLALPVLFRDAAMVVIDKPSGVTVHRGWARDGTFVVERLARQLGAPVFPVHRLDRGTSGVLALALDAAAARALGDAFAAHAVEKTYWALVRGQPPEDVVVDHPVPSGEEKGAPRVPAQTRVRRLRTFGRYALVEAQPLTGRLHQIRRHLKHLACPLIGDVNYGKGEHNRFFRTHYDLHRLFLHALRINLPHPVTGARLTFEAPLAPELAAVLARLDEYVRAP